MLARRFESYKAHVVKPFFRDHFARLDRQIVLVDALSAVNAGAAALADLQRTMEAVLQCFRPGANTWLSQHPGAAASTGCCSPPPRPTICTTPATTGSRPSCACIADKAIARAAFAGAEVKVMALAALRATREAEAQARAAQRLPCIVGVPLPGERLGAQGVRRQGRGRRVPRRPAGGPREPALGARRRGSRWRGQRPLPALPAAARQPRDARPARSRRCRTSASTAPSSSCSGTASHERPRRASPACSIPTIRPRRGAGRQAPSRTPRHARSRRRAQRRAADARRARPARPALGHAARCRRSPARQLLGVGAWFARLVSAALVRDDWVGWTTLALLLVAALRRPDARSCAS